MPDEIPPAKRQRNRRCNPLSIRNKCKAIANAIGCHYVTAEKWHYEGKMKHRILVYLLEQSGIERGEK